MKGDLKLVVVAMLYERPMPDMVGEVLLNCTLLHRSSTAQFQLECCFVVAMRHQEANTLVWVGGCFIKCAHGAQDDCFPTFYRYSIIILAAS